MVELVRGPDEGGTRPLRARAARRRRRTDDRRGGSRRGLRCAGVRLTAGSGKGQGSRGGAAADRRLRGPDDGRPRRRRRQLPRPARERSGDGARDDGERLRPGAPVPHGKRRPRERRPPAGRDVPARPPRAPAPGHVGRGLGEPPALRRAGRALRGAGGGAEGGDRGRDALDVRGSAGPALRPAGGGRFGWRDWRLPHRGRHRRGSVRSFEIAVETFGQPSRPSRSRIALRGPGTRPSGRRRGPSGRRGWAPRLGPAR